MESDLFRSSESKSKREREGRESMGTIRGEDPVFIGNIEGKVAGQVVIGSRRESFTGAKRLTKLFGGITGMDIGEDGIY